MIKYSLSLGEIYSDDCPPEPNYICLEAVSIKHFIRELYQQKAVLDEFDTNTDIALCKYNEGIIFSNLMEKFNITTNEVLKSYRPEIRKNKISWHMLSYEEFYSAFLCYLAASYHEYGGAYEEVIDENGTDLHDELFDLFEARFG